MVEPGSGADDPTIFLARHKNEGGVPCETNFELGAAFIGRVKVIGGVAQSDANALSCASIQC